MMTGMKRLAAFVCGAGFFWILTLAMAQPYIYPNQGQSPQQEQFDKGQCYSWAVQQTGFDPANPQVATAPPPMQQAPQGGMFRGAAGGAALGAVGGAIGGNAGEGECQKGAPQSVNLPQFFRVDFTTMTLRAVEENRESAIKNVDRVNGNMILQGVQGQLGWTLIISEDMGQMSATIAGPGEGYLIFGTCTLQ